ncbi:BTB/POZ and MATH domain-containing protein 1-like [Aegilops tauschii subsp. strangulata]|uniref:Speckle-type POZ protein-like protein n=1 Tax=Aegilops tauschii TaxID=37682 RepID=R7W656_AEGTA
MEASASLCTPSGVRSKLTFKISGYSFQRGFGVGKYFSSAAFNVGVYFWRIKYYPNEDYVSLSVELATRRGHPSSVLLSFANLCGHFLQPSAYLQDDNLAIECDITVLAAITVPPFDIQVPPSNLSDNLRELLKAGEGTDVTFKVRRESFPAHKIVLAMRSPIFKADLFGSMGDGTRRTITIEDMQPAIFSALLHFIYTDSLPSMGTSDGDDGEEMVKYLVVATNRYAMKRMKVIRESTLCKNLNV